MIISWEIIREAPHKVRLQFTEDDGCFMLVYTLRQMDYL